jgi:coenzyme PQQ precursor peptide PqqA
LRIFPAVAANALFDNAVETYEFGCSSSRRKPGNQRPGSEAFNIDNLTMKEHTMAWTKPEFTDLRFGFEVTMYIANR